MREFSSVVLLALLLLSACGKSSLRIGIIKPSIDHLPLSYGFQMKRMNAEIYTLVPFTSGWEVQEALVAGRVDAAIMPFTYVWNAAASG